MQEGDSDSSGCSMGVDTISEHSRLKQTFENISTIGSGAFGCVIKAQHKLDRCFYAIKCIKEKSEGDGDYIINEVKFLATLKHKHIVRYFEAWTENTENKNAESIAGSTSTSSSENSDFVVEFKKSSNCSSDVVSPSNQCYFIQMEFCKCKTLKNLIDENISSDVDLIWKIFGQIVDALAYIHRNKIIHRDLKPDNILLEYNNHVKIADFGFAVAAKKKKLSKHNISVYESRTGDVGTLFYMAPEIVDGDQFRKFYDQKVDIYSLGIIFFEMCHKPFYTDAERGQTLTNLRNKNIIFPETFNNVEQRKLIKLLLNHKVSQRPSAQLLLESDFVPPILPQDYQVRKLINHLLRIPEWKDYLTKRCNDEKFTYTQEMVEKIEKKLANSEESQSALHWR